MNRIKEARVRLNMGQKEIAIALGVAQPTVSAWESGRKAPTVENLSALAELFNVSTDFLLGRTNDPRGRKIVDYGKRIRELRAQKGISGAELARRVGLDSSQISKIENGASKPSLDALERICDALGLTLSEFFAVDNEQTTVAAHRSDKEYGDLPKEAVERIEELKALYRLKYRIDKDAQK